MLVVALVLALVVAVVVVVVVLVLNKEYGVSYKYSLSTFCICAVCHHQAHIYYHTPDHLYNYYNL